MKGEGGQEDTWRHSAVWSRPCAAVCSLNMTHPHSSGGVDGLLHQSMIGR